MSHLALRGPQLLSKRIIGNFPQRITQSFSQPVCGLRSKHTMRKQNSLPAAYYRGGTSRAVFFKEQDLPQSRDDWVEPFLGVIGSPDSYGRQLDGMGGGISSLSKICVVGPSKHPEADVDYTFLSLGIDNRHVDYSSNCGNMSSAVGPYAVDSGMVKFPDGVHESATVRIHNTNTGKIINATFPVVDGEATPYGDFYIDGVSGTAAPVRLDFIKPAGSRTGKLLPTGNITDQFSGITTTCIDVANPCCFVLASDLGVKGDLTPQEIDDHPSLKDTLDRVRRQAAVSMGLAATPEEAPGSVPKIAILSPSKEANGPLVARAMSVGQPHKALPVTVALAIAAAAKLPGSTVAGCMRQEVGETGLTISHASGSIDVDAKYNADGEIEVASVFRTARRLMEGKVFWK
ncbi:PrpF protein [Pestalotiopsis sp. NC0098]|nr:PrpF protein [Pestalotiopsis sp. NC0098]